MASAPIRRDVTASGVRLRVVEVGSGPAVLLLHGLLLDHTLWAKVVTPLSRDFRVLMPDLPGFGESAKPGPGSYPYTVEALAETVAGMMAGLQLGRCAVVGHGLGGAVALALAARHASSVARLAVINAACPLGPASAPHRLARAPVVGSFLVKQLIGRYAFRRLFTRWLIAPDSTLPSERVDHYYQRFNSPAARTSALAAIRATADTRTVVAQLARIEAPTTLLWGRWDRLYPASVGRQLARRIRNAGFQLFHAGHLVPEEAPEELAAALLAILAR